MDWKSLISDLKAAGLSQMQIAEKCGCGQATINDLANGNTSDPRYILGQKLLGIRNSPEVVARLAELATQKEG